MREKWRTQEVLKEVSNNAQENLKKAGKVVRNEAKRLCPVGTLAREGGQYWQSRTPGSLKKSIRYSFRKKTKSVRIIAGNRKVFYARFVEFGTKYTKDIPGSHTPFLQPAMENKKGDVLKIIKNG